MWDMGIGLEKNVMFEENLAMALVSGIYYM